MLVNKNILGLYNGVSQQPAAIRLDSQCEVQENCMSTLADGLFKRPPTEWINKLAPAPEYQYPWGGNFYHWIVRDETERYLVVIGAASGGVYVYDLQGNAKTVRYGTLDANLNYTLCSTGYLSFLSQGTTAFLACKAVTVADYTIIINKKVKPAMLSNITNFYPAAMCFVKNAINSINYRIFLNGALVAEYTAPATGPVTTGDVVNSLYNQLAANANVTPYFNLGITGSTILIASKTMTDFTYRCVDSWGDQAMVAIKNKVQSFTDLPAYAFANFYVEVEGDAGNATDSYYVKYVSDGTSKGVWQECPKYGIKHSMDPFTLPHQLVRMPDGTFVFGPCNWSSRIAGDEVSAPEPSFIGNYIKDVFFGKNRLGFLAGENIVLSKAGDFFNFWPTTAMDVLDDDPIDVAANTNQVTNLLYAVPFNTDILLFSQKVQFLLHSGNNALTPSTVIIDPTTAFEVSKYCDPVMAGANVYFASPTDASLGGQFTGYTAIREYFVEPQSLVNDAADVTAHVPKYLPSSISKLTASLNNDMLFAMVGGFSQGDTDPSIRNAIWVYKYYWKGDEKAQSAWSKWVLPYGVLDIEVIDNYLYIVGTTDTASTPPNPDWFIERIDLRDTTKLFSGCNPWSFKPRIDRLTHQMGTYDPATNRTSIMLWYKETSTNFQMIGEDGTLITEGITNDGTHLWIPGRHDNTHFMIGKTYTMKYQFSEWWIKPSQNQANMDGRLQMRTLELAYRNTSSFNVKVTPLGRAALVQPFSAATIGSYAIGELPLASGKRQFLLMCNAQGSTVTIESDSLLPSLFYAANFKGFYTTHSRQV